MKDADYKPRLISGQLGKETNLPSIYGGATASELSSPLVPPVNSSPELNEESLSVTPTNLSFERWRTSVLARNLGP
jgi:hypothetical protein